MFYQILVIKLLFILFGRCQQKDPINKIVLKSFTPASSCDKRFFSFGNLKIVQTASKETRLSGKVRLLQDIGKKITLESRLFRNSQGQESEEMTSVFLTICNDPAEANSLWPITVRPSYSKCPIRKGLFEVMNFTIPEGHLQFMPQENHHVETSIFRDGVKICGAKLEFDVVSEN